MFLHVYDLLTHFVDTQLNKQTILFQQFNLAYVNKVNFGYKYFYVSLTIQLSISHLFTHS